MAEDAKWSAFWSRRKAEWLRADSFFSGLYVESYLKKLEYMQGLKNLTTYLLIEAREMLDQTVTVSKASIVQTEIERTEEKLTFVRKYLLDVDQGRKLADDSDRVIQEKLRNAKIDERKKEEEAEELKAQVEDFARVINSFGD